MRRLIMTALLLATSLFMATAQADSITHYTIEPTHTQVTLSWNHFGFSHPRAVFKAISGTIQANTTTPSASTVAVTLQVASLDTGVPLLNEHLLSPPSDFFDVKKYPVISFNSTAIRNIDRDARRFDLVGQLTINGVSQEVVLAAQVNQQGPHPMWNNAQALGVDATTTIQRSAFGIDKFIPAVSDALDVRITLEAIESDAYQAAIKAKKDA